jgi:hypothetical protein
MSESSGNVTRYVEVCTDLVDGVCHAYVWVPMPGESIYTIADAVLISGAIAGVWAVGAAFRPAYHTLLSFLR